MALRAPPRADLIAALLLLVLPAVLLGDCVFGGRAFLPFDLAEFPPVATTLPRDELAQLRQGANYDATEAPVWFVPEWSLAKDAVRHGSYPHWNPWVRGGAPLAAHGHLGFCDPLHWPAFPFDDPAAGLLYLSCAMFALAGLLMYGLLRELQLGVPAALFGAVAFAWSGTLTANGHWYMRMEPLALLPGMLWALLRLDRAAGMQRALPAVALAVLVALCWTAGFPPFAIPVTLLAGGAGLLLAARAAVQRGAQGGVRLLPWVGLALLLGLALAGVQVLQQAAFFPESNRPPAPTLASASRFAFDPMGFLGYVLPEAFSHPSDRLLPSSRSPLAFLLWSRTEWGTGAPLRPDQSYNFTEYAVFPGTLPLLLAVLGLVLRGPRWRWACALAIAMSFVLAIGPGPAHLAYLVPGIQAVPPYRFVGPVCVFVAMLAALGFDRVARGAPSWVLRAGCVVCVAAAAYCLGTASGLDSYGEATERQWLVRITDRWRPLAPQFDRGLQPEQVTPELVQQALFTAHDDAGQPVDRVHLGVQRLAWNLQRAGFALLLGGGVLLLWSFAARGRPLAWWLVWPATLFTAIELFDFGHALDRGREPTHALDTPVHEFLRQQRDANAATGGFVVARANPAGGDPWHLPPGTLADDRIRDLHFYTFVDRHSSEPIRALYGDSFMLRDYVPQALPDDERLELPWWDLVGLRFLLTTAPMRHAGARVGPELSGPGGAFFVYERPNALPRAWVVPELEVVADDAAAYAAVLQPGFRPRERVVVTQPEAARLPPLAGAPAPGDGAAAARGVTFAVDDATHVVLRVEAGAPGWLVLADTALSGWTATVDGEPAPIARGNAWQRVVALPAAACEVAFAYRTPGLVPGLLLSLLAGAGAASLLVAARRARRRAAAAAAAVIDVSAG